MENLKSPKAQQGHIIRIENRQRIDITGVTEVVTFSEDNVILHTIMGGLNIKGKNMKVNKLNVDSGDMCIEGEIQSLVYTSKDTQKKESLIKKMFK